MIQDQSRRDLVAANRVLDHEGIFDAFGHLSIRHPGEPKKYVIGRSLSPGLLTIDDLQEFWLDGTRADDDDRSTYAEIAIHGAIYAARPDVTAVCHNHSRFVIPFGVTGTPLRPIFHTAGLMGAEIPSWDSRTAFGETDLLVRTMEMGRSLAATLGDRNVALMRGHGSVVVGTTLQNTVITTIYMERNAQLQLQAMAMGDVTYLSNGEVDETSEMLQSPKAIDRVWRYWLARAGVSAD